LGGGGREGAGQLQYRLAFVRDVANTMSASAVAGAAVEGLKLESLNRLQVCAVCLHCHGYGCLHTQFGDRRLNQLAAESRVAFCEGRF
jgi:hypothetical protein